MRNFISNNAEAVRFELASMASYVSPRSSAGFARVSIEDAMRPVASRWKIRLNKANSYSRKGGESLLENAMKKAGVSLPYNWKTWALQPAMWGEPKIRHLLPLIPRFDWMEDQDGQKIQLIARMAGFFNAVAASPRKYSRVSRLLKKTTSSRGTGSPYCVLNALAVAAKWENPGRLDAWLAVVRKKATEIMSAYGEGLKPSWDSLAQLANEGYSAPHKAALRAASATLEQMAYHFQFAYVRTYRAAVAFLVEHRGLSAFIAKKIRPDQIGVYGESFESRKNQLADYEKFGRSVVRSTDIIRRFNLPPIARVQNVFVDELGDFYISAKHAMKNAIDKKRIEKKLAAKEAASKEFMEKILDYCKTSGAFLELEDSLAAGYCKSGTIQWVLFEFPHLADLARIGCAKIPASDLVVHLKDERVLTLIAKKANLKNPSIY